MGCLSYRKTTQQQNSREPLMVICSALTITTFCPPRSSFATTDARRPSMWPRPSIMIGFSNMIRATSSYRRRDHVCWWFALLQPLTSVPAVPEKNSDLYELQPCDLSYTQQLRVLAVTSWSFLGHQRTRRLNHSSIQFGYSNGDLVLRMFWIILR